MEKANRELRIAMLDAGIPFWRIALALGLSEQTLIRQFRIELPEDKRQRVMDAIEQIKQEAEK